MQQETPGRKSVLPSGNARLVMRAAFLRRLIDTAHALEGEVALLRLQAALGTADDTGHGGPDRRPPPRSG